MASATQVWLSQLKDILGAYRNNMALPSKYSPMSRAVQYSVIFPVCCSTCILWSTVWRLMCCPIVTYVHGPAYMCSNNGCTEVTDRCIQVYANDMNAIKTMPTIPDRWNEEEKRELNVLLGQLEFIFKNKQNVYTRREYDLAHACFGVMPSGVDKRILSMRRVAAI